MNSEISFKEESFKIIGACFEVYNHMGSGFLEAVYQECLTMEFPDQDISFIDQPHLRLKYKTKPLKQTYVPDFLCFDKIVVEIKAVKELADDHRAQTINYLKATDLQLALLVNFGHHSKLIYERFVNLPHSQNSCDS